MYLTHYRTVCATEPELLSDVFYPQKVHWFPDTFARVSTGLHYPPHKVAEKVLDPELLRDIRENPVGKTAFILAAGSSHFAGINPQARKTSRLSYTYKILPLTLTQVYAGRIAQSLGISDYIATDATACASSMKVLMDAQTLISMYGFQRVVVLSVEDTISNTVLDFFGETGACLTQEAEAKTGIRPSAFDDVNQGFYVGQGAVLAVFDAVARGNPHARVLGTYTASEACSNALGQREDGAGFVAAMEGAMSIAKVKPRDIRVVKTHGTGTKSNNVAEKAAISGTLQDFVATSYKQKIGHTMGPSGLLETCLLLDDIRSGFVPGIANRTTEDATYLSRDVLAPPGLIMSLAAGMGNVYSAAVLTTDI